jgi:hypothetical protein
VDQESPSQLESDNQILATTLDASDTLTDELGCHDLRLERTYEQGIEDRRPLYRPSDEHGLDAAADGLDLGELGHETSVGATARSAACRLAVVRGRLCDHVEQNPPIDRGRVSDRVCRADRIDRCLCGRLVSRVYLCQIVACKHAVAALREAENTHGVIDGVSLGPTARAELERRDSDSAGLHLRDDAVSERGYRDAHGRIG